MTLSSRGITIAWLFKEKSAIPSKPLYGLLILIKDGDPLLFPLVAIGFPTSPADQI